MADLENHHQYTFLNTLGGRILDAFMQGHEIQEIATLHNMSVRDIRIQIDRFYKLAGRNRGRHGRTLDSDRRAARNEKEKFYSEIENALAQKPQYREFFTGEFMPHASVRTRHVILGWTDISTNEKLKECIVTGRLNQRNYNGEKLTGLGPHSFRECCISVGLDHEDYLRNE